MTLVESIRRFSRFYTKQIGVLNEGLLRSPFSLTEVRVLYEIAHRDRPTAAEVSNELRIDPGYLSRILRRFQKQGLVRRQTSTDDGRRSLLSMTDKGRRTFATLDTRQDEEVAALVAALPAPDQRRLVDALATIEQILGAPAEPAKTPYLLRQHQPGEMGWVVHRHGALYAQEFGYDERFEALVARIVADFVERQVCRVAGEQPLEPGPARERCWIAEKDGEIVGSVFLVKSSDTVAQLRLLYVEPRARGLGIGERLVEECIRFARQARYRKVTLWTQSHLDVARHVYEKKGFTLTAEEPHHSYGLELVAETWEIAL